MNYQLDDRVMVVTGAGSGIGLATCRVLLEEGARVVAGDLDPSAAAALTGAVTPVTVDLSTPTGAEQLISAALGAHGDLDVLVNNVGAFPFRESFLAVSGADWNALMDVNFYSMVRACRAALPHMVKLGRGAIVSVASDVGRAPDRFFVDYSVSKAAVLMLSKAISVEFGPAGSAPTACRRARPAPPRGTSPAGSQTHSPTSTALARSRRSNTSRRRSASCRWGSSAIPMTSPA